MESTVGEGETTGGRLYHYRCGELRIASAIPFPELGAETAPRDGALRIFPGAGDATPEAGPVERDWRMPDGSVWTTFRRAGAGWLITFPGYAAFLLTGGGEAVDAFPRPGVAPQTVRHLLLNQIFPLALCARGRHTFHASAVAVDGRAAVFSGVSGAACAAPAAPSSSSSSSASTSSASSPSSSATSSTIASFISRSASPSTTS